MDLYCGSGTIGLYLAKEAKKVIGIEISDESIKAALENAQINNVDNAEFIQGRAEDEAELIEEKIDTLIIDPPRKGCDKKLIDAIIEMKPTKVVYVSCNPATLSRDINLLKDNYKVEKATPIDLFPQTSHVETVVLMSKKN